ncbi:MAG: alpha/beta hydrolase [Candidatus Hydrogenedentota bacterium]|nr:MAG: alpha/beta hydrolase [Candidatus Hydrogenedentota bacterium]
MIHGFGTGGWVWEGYSKIFEQQGFTCMALDLPFHGTLDEPPPPQLGNLSVTDYVSYVKNEIRNLAEKPIVMAHSAGTVVAQLLMAEGLVHAAVLLTPIPPAGISALNKNALKTVGSVLGTWGFWRKPVRVTFDEIVFAALHLSTNQEQHRVYDRFGYDSGRFFLEMALALVNPRSPLRINSSSVTCPVLVTAGDEDRTTPPSVARKIARKYGADYKEFKGHAHWPLGEPGWEIIAQQCAHWMIALKND